MHEQPQRAAPTGDTVAFIGLGHMGGPMAVNLFRAGHDVIAFDLSAEACEAARAAGLRVAPSAADAVAGAGTVISMLPASRHVASLYLGDAQTPPLLDAIARGTLLIDSSTISAATARDLAAFSSWAMPGPSCFAIFRSWCRSFSGTTSFRR